MLETEDFLWELALHKILPRDEILTFCDSFHVWRELIKGVEATNSAQLDVTQDPLCEFWMGVVVVEPFT